LPDLITVILSFITIYFFFSKKINLIYEIKKNFFLFFFLIICAASTIYNYGFDIISFKSVGFIRFFFLIIIINYIIKSNNKIINLNFIILCMTLFFVCFDSYIQFFFGTDIFGYKIQDPKRLSGLFGNEYILGSFLINFAPLIFYFAAKYSKCKNYLLFFFFIIIEPLIFIAGQRAPFFMSIILIFCCFIYFYKDKVFYINFFSSLLIILLILVFNKNYSERYFFDVKANLNYKNEILVKNNKLNLNFSILTPSHTSLYANALNMFLDKPITGHGIKSFRKICQNYNINGCSTHPHNYYLEILVEAGIFAFLILTLFYIKLLKKFAQHIKDIILIKKFNKNFFILLTLLIFFFPLKSSGSIFNNYIMIQGSYLLALYFYVKKNSI